MAQTSAALFRGFVEGVVKGDMNSTFSEEKLADKLSKLNGTQQCIESLSRWCVVHRSKAEFVVETWDKQFRNSDMLQKVPLLYLANDILQNSKKKGTEFVDEFWKVLPAALKYIVKKGDDRGKNVVSRLVNIWEERIVFGSRSLKEVMLGEDAPPPLELSKKRSRSVKNTKRDSRSIRTKLSIGGSAEKLVSAFNLVVSERPNEEAEMSNCKSGVRHVRDMQKDVDIACSNNDKDPTRKALAKELESDENLLKQCIEKLKSVEACRVALVSQLKESLQEQESKLEEVRAQRQVAQAQVEEASKMRRRLNGEVLKASSTAIVPVDSNPKAEQTHQRTAAAIAAEVAEKLAASSSSQMIMHAVLSTFAAEEAKNAQLTKAPTPPQPLKLNFMYFRNSSSQQYLQPAGGIMTPYAHGNTSTLPPGPPPPPPYKASSMVPMTQQPSQMPQQQPLSLAQQRSMINQQQQMSSTQQTLGANFRPHQPPVMEYYAHPSHS
ncbi:hypothetical protein OIU84_006367 [Salix udensis]|uniref:CID domain-containing protein n=1 Tax=Salix udensis TaxID=889485 RepID=A0AAD6JY97_9ROSI|nr:hypothetical protein OIU84_006367 [Salix udensis]